MSLDIPQWSRSIELYMDEVKDFPPMRQPLFTQGSEAPAVPPTCDTLIVASDTCAQSFISTWLLKNAVLYGTLRPSLADKASALSELDESNYWIKLYSLKSSHGATNIKIAVPNSDIPSQLAPGFAQKLLSTVAPSVSTILLTSLPAARYVPEAVSRVHLQRTESIVAPYLVTVDNSAARAAGYAVPSPTDVLPLYTTVPSSPKPTPSCVPIRGMRPPNMLTGLTAALLEYSEVEALRGHAIPMRAYITLDDLNHYSGEAALALEAALFNASEVCGGGVETRRVLEQAVRDAFNDAPGGSATTADAVVARARAYRDRRLADLEQHEIEARARLQKRMSLDALGLATREHDTTSTSTVTSPKEKAEEKKTQEVKELEESREAAQTHLLKKRVPNIFA